MHTFAYTPTPIGCVLAMQVACLYRCFSHCLAIAIALSYCYYYCLVYLLLGRNALAKIYSTMISSSFWTSTTWSSALMQEFLERSWRIHSQKLCGIMTDFTTCWVNDQQPQYHQCSSVFKATISLSSQCTESVALSFWTPKHLCIMQVH